MNVRRRLALQLTALGALALLLAALPAAALLRASAREAFVDRLRNESLLLGAQAARLGADSPPAFAVSASRAVGARVTLIAADGRVVGDSTKDEAGLAGMDNHAERPEIVAARLRGAGESYRRSDTTSLDYFYAAHRVEGGGPIKFVRLAAPLNQLPRSGAARLAALLALLAGSLFLTGLVAYRAMARYSRSVEAVSRTVERAAAEENPAGLATVEAEPLPDLEAALRHLQQTLVHKLDELDSERSLLASVVSGMKGGLLLVGADRRIRLANAAVRELMAGRLEPTGRLLAEVVRHPTVIGEVESALAHPSDRQTVLRLHPSGRAFELHVSPLRQAAGGTAVLVLLFEITRLEQLEAVRRQFVANVSHELRTPLTAIKAAVETLLEGGVHDAAHATRFLDIIQRHADRMGALIEDLTDLSLIETGAVRLDPREVDAAAVAREVAEQLRPLAEARDVRLLIDLPGPAPVHADRRRLEQMLMNLLQNGIKFNRPGGRVRIHAEARAAGLALHVEDNGIGIPSDSQDKIFHRFYRVDEGRSRELGGTGLGLAIVKHLMRLHGGSVELQSELGQGSTFTLVFPRTRSS